MKLGWMIHTVKLSFIDFAIKLAFFLFIQVMLVCSSLGNVGGDSIARPNVLFLAVDDLRPELGAYGSQIKTPNMDRLASKGMIFERAYCQQAVCGASRLSIMSGIYPTLSREQTYHVENWRKRHPNLITLNQYFKEQGYQTIGLGKIYHGDSGPGVDPKNWTEWIKVQSNGHYLRQENIELLRKARSEKKGGDPKDPPKGPMTESADVPDDAYLDGKRADRAIQILRDLSQNSKQPFFLAVGLSKPHLPFCAPQKYWNLYDRGAFTMPPNTKIPPGYPAHAANLKAMEMNKYSDYEGRGPEDFSDSTNRRLLHGYAAATSYVDACVGRVLNALEESGLAQNTVVVLWGDHGWKLGDHSSWCKHTNFECDTRVPLIIFDPREEGGKRTSRLIELIDLYPTLCDFAGLPIPQHCQGRSFRRLLKDPEAGHRYDAYSSYPAHQSMGHSIRFKNYRYTEWRDAQGEVKANVLTDLAADPGEETNVKDAPDHADALSYGMERLQVRINQALESSYSKEKKEFSPSVVKISVDHEKVAQEIRGFGGSIAFWGTNPSDEAMQYAFKELGTSILRVQGEVKKNGNGEHSKEVLQRAMKINPNLEVLLTFWQPRSPELLDVSDWLDIVEWRGGKVFVLKQSMEDAWAEEIVRRIREHLEWG
ncbi:MAG: sulfatase, partial [Opitutae bacterium]